MNWKFVFAVCLSVAALLPLNDVSADPSNMLSNGGFETGLSGSWTTSGSIDRIVTGTWSAFEGSYFLDMVGTPGSGTISQTIPTIPGQSYFVSFALAANPTANGSANKVLEVSASGVFGVGSFTVARQNNVVWEEKTWQFTANSASTTVSLKGVPQGSDNLNGPLLDVVHVCANLVDNGSFEVADVGVSPPAVPGGNIYIGDDNPNVDAPNSTTIKGWTVHEIDWAALWNASDGNLSLDMNGLWAGYVEQSFDTVIGQKYRVTFNMTGGTHLPALSLRATVANVSQDFGADPTGTSGNTVVWHKKTFEFTATSMTSTLRLQSLNFATNWPNRAGGPALDNVRVCASVANQLPVALCQNIVVPLDANGNASITAAQVNNGSYDPDGGPVSLSVSPSSFNCDNLGVNTVTLTVTDQAGTTSTCPATVTVVDVTPPVISLVGANPQVIECSIAYAELGGTAIDVCDGNVSGNIAIDASGVDASTVGTYTVTYNVSDGSNNAATQVTRTVNVVDTTTPTVVTQNITIQLDATGVASIAAAQIDNGSSDACSDVTLALSQTAFDCNHVGENTVTLTVTDAHNNSAIGTAVVTVQDVTPPVVVTQNIVVDLNALGQVSITAAAVDGGSSDACGIASMSLSQTTFDCNQVGENTVTLTATDVNNNSATGTAVVTVRDVTAPDVLTQNIVVDLDANGQASITAAAVDNGSSDACGIASLVVSPNTFDCDNVGDVTVTLTAVDVNGNSASKTAIVTVRDVIAPVVVTQNVIVNLDANGQGSTTASAVDNGSSDACGIASLALSKTQFTCLDLGENEVTLTVIDVNGNVANNTAIVTVNDVTAPVVTLMVAYPDPLECESHSGNVVTLSASSFDACDDSPVFSWSEDGYPLGIGANIAPTFPLGIHTVSVIATDASGNVSVAQVLTFEIVDTTLPVLHASASSEYLWPPNHKYHVINFDLSATDICDANVSTFHATVVSSEADDAQESGKGKNKSNGDGNTTGDIQVTLADESVIQSSDANPVVSFNPITDVLELRAERAGNNAGRVYTVTLTATDAEGNISAPVVMEVVVDHDQSASKPALTKPVLGGDSAVDGGLAFGVTNYPNPFNPETVIMYTLPEDSSVRLVIYNVLGQQVRALVNDHQAPGQYGVRWNSRDDLGRAVSSGVYFYRLEAGSNVMMKKMLLMK